jgi:hypothetical protein
MYLPLGIPSLNSLKGKGSHSIDHSLTQLIRGKKKCNIEKKEGKIKCTEQGTRDHIYIGA